MGIISPFHPPASSGNVPGGSGGTLNCSAAMPPEPAITPLLLEDGEGGVPAPPDPETWLMEDLPDIVYDRVLEMMADAANMPVPPAFSHSLHEHLRAWAKNKVTSHRFSDMLDLEDGDIRAFVAALAGKLS